MDFLKQNKIAIGGVIVLILAGYVYFAYFSGGGSSATLSSSDTDSTLSQNLLVTLQNLQTIQLDNSIFTDPAFISLTDFGVTIPLEAVGNSDPFLPPTSAGSATAGSVQLPAGTH